MHRRERHVKPIKLLRKPFFRNFRTFGPCFSWRSESTASSAQRKVSWQWRVSLSWLISRGVREFTCSHGQWLSPYLTSELCWPGHAVIFPLSTVWYQNCSVRTFWIFWSRADQHHLTRGKKENRVTKIDLSDWQPFFSNLPLGAKQNDILWEENEWRTELLVLSYLGAVCLAACLTYNGSWYWTGKELPASNICCLCSHFDIIAQLWLLFGVKI